MSRSPVTKVRDRGTILATERRIGRSGFLERLTRCRHGRIIAVELGASLVRDPSCPTVRPDGTLTGIANLDRAKDTARCLASSDRRGERIETDEAASGAAVGSTDVMDHVAKLTPKSERVEWDRCFQCGRKMKYKPGSGRFCRVECREAFGNGAEPYAAQPHDRLAA
jgi:hypothetical protein